MEKAVKKKKENYNSINIIESFEKNWLLNCLKFYHRRMHSNIK